MPKTCSDKLKLLADPTRLAVLKRLLGGPRHVMELASELAVSQPLLSHHLRSLRDAGFVTSKRDGKRVLYALNLTAKHRGALDLGCCRLKFA